MYSTAHLAMGLILGRLTGDYPTAIISSVAIDVDHLLPYLKEGSLFKIKKIWQGAKKSDDSRRNYLHSFYALPIISGLICLFSWHVGLVFALGYLFHFALDILDDSDFWPFYPSKKWNIRGFIGYYSGAEFMLAGFLYLVFFLMLLF
jgi:membrane-bound metal-dependent hydrolase YbcI (DUF457 family)